MSDLISISSLLKNSTQIEFRHSDGTTATYISVKAVELEQKYNSVDAVEIVRCGECKYYGYILTCGCSLIELSDYGIATMKPDDFCSYGERKEVNE